MSDLKIAKILSLNLGKPELMQWDGKSVTSSMRKSPVPGPLVVEKESVQGNIFASPQLHGSPDAVLYAFGLESAMEFVKILGRTHYEPGSVGETLTLDSFDETQVSVGDVFEIGEVLAQAVLPRIPCGKVDIRMQHPKGQWAMQECGRSGVYFRILRPGRIFITDSVKRVETALPVFPIAGLYRKMVSGEKLSVEEIKLALNNGAFPEKMIRRLTKLLHERA